MKIISVSFSAARDGQSFLVEKDAVLEYATAGNRAVISCDPAATIANRITAPADAISHSDIAIVQSSNLQYRTAFPLSAGELIYLSVAAATVVQLFFTELS